MSDLGEAAKIKIIGATAEITGGMNVNNFPAVQPVSFAGGIAVTNLPAVQPVNDNGGSITVDGTVGISGTVPVTGPVTNTELRAVPLPVSGTVGVSGTLPVSGPLTDTQLRASGVPVTGSFYPATQPVSLATAPTTPVTGTFWQSLQPVSGPLTDTQLRALAVAVSIASMPTTPVTGTFWQALQPVSVASLPLPSGASTEATLALIKAKTDNLDVLLSTRTKPADTQPVSLASQPLPTGASTEATLALIKAKTDNLDVLLSTRTKPADTQPVSLAALPVLAVQAAAGSVPHAVVSLGNSLGKTLIGKTATLATTLATADQVVLTYTVTAGKTLYLQYIKLQARLTAYAATSTLFGEASLESPAGTKLLTLMLAGPGQSVEDFLQLDEAMPIAAGTVIRVVCTPSAVANYTWRANFGGYEK